MRVLAILGIGFFAVTLISQADDYFDAVAKMKAELENGIIVIARK